MEILFKYNKTKSKDPKGNLESFVYSENKIKNLNIKDLISLYDEISNYWLSANCKIKNVFASEGLGFVIPYLKKNNTEKILRQNFSDFSLLDSPRANTFKINTSFAYPMGIAVHWIAGNVPVLGVISLFQSLLTKNKSIVKVPQAYKKILPLIFSDLKKNLNYFGKYKSNLEVLLSSTLILYMDRDDDYQKKLSEIADVRIAWGGLDAIQDISNLPKKISCRDLIFGPKLSLAIVGKEKLQTKKDIVKLSNLLANDIFPFDQAGCNAPHNLVIEKGSNFKTEYIAEIMNSVFKEKIKKISTKNSPIDSYNVLLRKFVNESMKDNFSISSESNLTNIFYSKKNKIIIEEPLFARSIFISITKNLNNIKSHLPTNIQSVGTYMSDKKKIELISNLSPYGVDRFPDLGKMSLYQNPWDGYLPLQSMVRWISYK